MPATLPLTDPLPTRPRRASWRLAQWAGRRHRSPALDALTPGVPVRVLRADGTDAHWREGAALRPALPVAAAFSGIVAIEYPEDRLLRRRLTLPDMTSDEVEQAASLDAHTASPFRADDLVWGHHCTPLDSGQLHVEIVLASRAQVQQYLAQCGARLRGLGDPEVWALAGARTPVVIGGFGEARRARRRAQSRWLLTALFAVAWLAVIGIAVTPTAQLRLRALEAVGAYDALHRRAAPAVSTRESLSQVGDQLVAFNALTADRVRALEIVDLLTRVLPDDSSLLSLQIQGAKVSIGGLTTNTADLMQKLSAHPGLRDVKAPSAATRPLGANKESFSIEFDLSPAALTAPAPSSPAAPSNAVPPAASSRDAFAR